MAVKHKDQRVGIFLDVQNLYHSAKNLYQNARVNYKELIRYLVAGRQLIRALAYVVKAEGVGEGPAPERGEARTGGAAPERGEPRPDSGSGREAAFFEALSLSGIELRMKDIQVYAGGVKKADWDVGLAVDAIRMADSLDVAVLVTGDGDFIPLVDYLKWGRGRQVEVAAFSRTASGKLREAADTFVPIEEIPRILIKK